MQNEKGSGVEQIGVREGAKGITLRSMVISILILFVVIYMANMGDYAGLTPASSLETMPIVPGIFVGVLLLLANLVLRKSAKRLSFSNAEIVSSYIFVTVGSMIANLGVVQSFAIAPAALRLNIDQRPELYQSVGERLSSWLMPPSSTVWDFYLGGVEKVPWGKWLVPLALWFVFFGLLVFLFLCIGSLFTAKWLDEDRLGFPIAEASKPLLTLPEKDYAKSFWQNKIMWIGFTISFLIMGSRVLNTYVPGIPAFPMTLGFVKKLPESVIRTGLNTWPGMDIIFLPVTIGLAYLVPTQVALGIWLAWFTVQGMKILCAVTGVPNAEMPGLARSLVHTYTYGSYITFSAFFLWLNRHTVRRAINGIFSKSSTETSYSLMNDKVACMGAVVSIILLVLFLNILIGMDLWVAVGFLFLLIIASISFSRLRGQTGVPSNIACPNKAVNIFRYGFGTDVIGRWNLIPLGIFWGLVELPSLPVFAMEGCALADDAKLNRKSVTKIILLAYVFAFAIGFGTLLPVIYKYGAGMMQISRTNQVNNGLYVAELYNEPVSAEWFALAIGAISSLALMLFHTKYAWWPIHPLGYALGWHVDIGFWYWGSFFIVWIVKTMILRYGGYQLHDKLKPCFIGMVFGGVVVHALQMILAIVL